MVWGSVRPSIVGPGLPVEEFLTGSLVIDGDTSSFENLRVEALRQLRADAGIAGVTASAAVPLDERFADIEVEGGETSGIQARFNSVDEQFFEVFGARMLSGRGFEAGDFGPGHTPVIVNQSFVWEILGGGNGLGQRVRYRDTEQTRHTRPPSGTHEIVGVVEDFPGDNDGPMMFHPLTLPVPGVTVTVSAVSGIAPAASRLRVVASGLDSQLRLGSLRALDDIYWQRRSLDQTFGFGLGIVMMVVLLFSIAGLYTLTTLYRRSAMARDRRESGTGCAAATAARWHLRQGVRAADARSALDVPWRCVSIRGCRSRRPVDSAFQASCRYRPRWSSVSACSRWPHPSAARFVWTRLRPCGCELSRLASILHLLVQEAIGMNALRRRWCGIALVAVLVAPAAASAQTVRDFSQLPGSLRQGQALVVTDQNRTKVTGRLVSVSATELTITTKTGDMRTFQAVSVREIRPPDPWWTGALIGGGIAAIPASLAAANANEPGAFPAALVVIGVFAGIGAGIDALIPAPVLYSSLRQGIVTIAPIVNRDRQGVQLAWRF